MEAVVISLKPTLFPGGWIQSQLWYLWTLLTQSGVLSHWVLDMKEMDLCWEVSSGRYKALWELASGPEFIVTQIQLCSSLLFSSLQFGIVGFGSAISACSHVLVHRPRGQCTDVMPLSVRACAIRSSFQALHWPLKHWCSKWISLKWKHYKTWRSKQALLISNIIYIYVSGFGIFAI